MKENKGGELQCLSVQQPTGHRIVVESPSRDLQKNIRNPKNNTRLPLKWPETNYRSCSVKLSSRHLKEFGLQWRFSLLYGQGLGTWLHRREIWHLAENEKFAPIYNTFSRHVFFPKMAVVTPYQGFCYSHTAPIEDPTSKIDKSHVLQIKIIFPAVNPVLYCLVKCALEESRKTQQQKKFKKQVMKEIFFEFERFYKRVSFYKI